MFLEKFVNYKKEGAFTLAETLITLAVVGIVAAMSVPTLINYTNAAKFRSQFKKSVSTLNQAALTAKANYGLDFGSSNALCQADVEANNNIDPMNVWSVCALFNSTLKGWTYYGKLSNVYKLTANHDPEQYQLVERETLPDNYMDFLAYSFLDGTLLAIHPDMKGCILPLGKRPTQEMFAGPYSGIDLSHCIGFIDVNGPTLPNSEVACTHGDNKVGTENTCVVNNSGHRFRDVFPIFMHDTTVEPASGASQYVLDTSKI